MKKIWILILFVGSIQGLYGQSIAALEYFFDTDPGVGNGVVLPLINPSDTVVASSLSSSVAALSPGFHTLFMRAKDVNGVWGLYTARSFYVSESISQLSAPLAEWEYYFDVDPGAGNGIQGTFPVSPVDTTDFSTSTATSGLTPGFHTLFARIKDEDGKWGLSKKRSFYVQDTSRFQSPPLLTYEFFIDSMSGEGNGIYSFDLGPDDTLDYNIGLSSSFLNLDLSPGFHDLIIRWKDTDGVWGLYDKRSMYVQDSTLPRPASPIELVEYFIDTEPGIGNGTQITVNPPLDTVDNNYSASTMGLANGQHIIGVRVKDVDGRWSVSEIDSFNIGTCGAFVPPVNVTGSSDFCQGDSVILSTLSSYQSYLWSNGATSASIVVRDSGTFTVTVTDALGCNGTSLPVVVNGTPGPQPVIQANGPTNFCDRDSVILSTMNSYSSYSWSNGANSSSIIVRQSGNYSVSVSDVNGCMGISQSISISVAPPVPVPSIISLAGDSLRCSEMGISYIWYLDGNVLPISSRTIHATQSGVYEVVVIGNLECLSEKSEPLTYWLTNLENELNRPIIARIYPNPSSATFYLELDTETTQRYDLSVYNLWGQPIFEQKNQLLNAATAYPIHLGGNPAGVYRLYIRTLKGQSVHTIQLRY